MEDYSNGVLDVYATAKQIEELNSVIIQLRKQVVLQQAEIENYEKMKIPRTVLQQFIEQEAKIRKLEEDLKFYKKHVNPQIIINREHKEQPTRRGGIPK